MDLDRRGTKRWPERWAGGSRGSHAASRRYPAAPSAPVTCIQPGVGKPWVPVTMGPPSPRPFQHTQKKPEESIRRSDWNVKRNPSILGSDLRVTGSPTSSATPWAQQGLPHPARKMGPWEHPSVWGFSGCRGAGPAGGQVGPSARRWAPGGRSCLAGPPTSRRLLPCAVSPARTERSSLCG